MSIAEIISNPKKKRLFSLEVTPPLRGNGSDVFFMNVDTLFQLNPSFINITLSGEHPIYKVCSDGMFQKLNIRQRPGSLALASELKRRYTIPIVSHITCNDSAEDIEETNQFAISWNN